MKRKTFITIVLCSSYVLSNAQQLETIKYGDFENWVTREISESNVIGGKHKTIYEVGPTQSITENIPYKNLDDSPWATSNVYAKVSGVTKASNAVYPFNRSTTDKCAKLCTQMEQVKVLGIINMDVMVAGSMFLGEMIEPISSTSEPYKKMNMGVAYTKSPKFLSFDYKIDMPDTDCRIKSTGFGSKKTLPGRDSAVVFVLLQRRWEDEDGNLHAARVATGGQHFSNGTQWINGYNLPLTYGDVSDNPDFSWLDLRNGDNAYYARNSKGKLVKVNEDTWDTPSSSPTHVIVMFSSGDGEPFIGTEGLNFYVDNVAFGF